MILGSKFVLLLCYTVSQGVNKSVEMLVVLMNDAGQNLCAIAMLVWIPDSGQQWRHFCGVNE